MRKLSVDILQALKELYSNIPKGKRSHPPFRVLSQYLSRSNLNPSLNSLVKYFSFFGKQLNFFIEDIPLFPKPTLVEMYSSTCCECKFFSRNKASNLSVPGKCTREVGKETYAYDTCLFGQMSDIPLESCVYCSGKLYPFEKKRGIIYCYTCRTSKICFTCKKNMGADDLIFNKKLRKEGWSDLPICLTCFIKKAKENW